MRRQIKHGQSHASLLQDVSASSVPSSRSRLNAIVVPAARPAPGLQEVISLSASLSVPLVILCSREAQIDLVAKQVADTSDARALVIEVAEDYVLPDGAAQASAESAQAACAGRSSDLSVKRNIGLLLGRLRGWDKILFIDDDIRGFLPADIERLAGCLDRHAVASMVSRHFPDNSVVCHARRLAGLRQDVFVGGSVLGVDLQQPELSFFPDIYNEDWFFFARQAAARDLPKIGEVQQMEYLPFADPQRAEDEEFGDLLAEGLYARFEATPDREFEDQLALAARASYWQRFTEIRLKMIGEIQGRLSHAQYGTGVDHQTIEHAQESLRRAESQASRISADLCVDFLGRWKEDNVRWREILKSSTTGLSERDALTALGLTRWISCGHGIKSTSAGSGSSKPYQDLASAADDILTRDN